MKTRIIISGLIAMVMLTANVAADVAAAKQARPASAVRVDGKKIGYTLQGLAEKLLQKRISNMKQRPRRIKGCWS